MSALNRYVEVFIDSSVQLISSYTFLRMQIKKCNMGPAIHLLLCLYCISASSFPAAIERGLKQIRRGGSLRTRALQFQYYPKYPSLARLRVMLTLTLHVHGFDPSSHHPIFYLSSPPVCASLPTKTRNAYQPPGYLFVIMTATANF